MNKKELEAFAKQAAKGIKSEKDLTDFRRILTKITVEAALNAELEELLVMRFMSNPPLIVAEMATHLSPFVPKTAKLNSKHLVIEKVVLSHS